MREGRTRQHMNFLGKRTHESFNMRAVMGLAHGPEEQLNAVLLAGAAQHGTPKIFAVITMQSAHLAPNRPRRREAPFREQSVFRQNGSGHTHPDGGGTRRFQRQIKADHHTAEDIDGDREPGPG